MSPQQTGRDLQSALASRHPRDRSTFRHELIRSGVERLIGQALEVEAELHVSRHREDRDARGKRLVVRNGYLPSREIRTGAGWLRVHQPRIHDARVDRHGRRHRFASQILPAYSREAACIGRPAVETYLRDLAAGDLTRTFQETFGSIVGELPRSFVPRLAELWEVDRERLDRRTFHGREPAELWADEVALASGAGEGVLLLAATAPEGIEVLDARLGRPGDAASWRQLATGLADRGLALAADRLHASAPEAARVAAA